MHALDPTVAVLVVGAGAMGSGIAHVAARAGHRVYLHDQNAAAIERGRAGIAKDLQFLVGKGKLEATEADATLERVIAAPQIAQAAEVGLALEAIVEDLQIKQDLMCRLEALLPSTTILASNTSSLSITALAAALNQPQRLAGMHFFNPAPRMALVEIVSGLATPTAVADCLFATAQAWGKQAVHTRSTPGFIVNRVARPYYAEALRVLAEQAASVASIDTLLRESGRFPMGPFELMDLIGNDVNFAVTRSVYEAFFGDRRFQPSLLQQELVLAGRLGRKSGHGFYRYDGEADKPVVAKEAPRPAPARLQIAGDLGPAEGLARRIEAAIPTAVRTAGDGFIRIGEAILALSDGRPATIRAAATQTPDLILFDLAFDYGSTPRLAVSTADSCSDAAFDTAVGLLQSAGIEVCRLDDIAGLIVLRTVCMLANEAADAVNLGVATEADVDKAMRKGTNYPAGPLAWARALGLPRVVTTLDHLQQHYGEERYRVSPWLRRRACATTD